jgi:hypothetical protein
VSRLRCELRNREADDGGGSVTALDKGICRAAVRSGMRRG